MQIAALPQHCAGCAPQHGLARLRIYAIASHRPALYFPRVARSRIQVLSGQSILEQNYPVSRLSKLASASVRLPRRRIGACGSARRRRTRRTWTIPQRHLRLRCYHMLLALLLSEALLRNTLCLRAFMMNRDPCAPALRGDRRSPLALPQRSTGARIWARTRMCCWAA